jgi:hypothetical protein
MFFRQVTNARFKGEPGRPLTQHRLHTHLKSQMRLRSTSPPETLSSVESSGRPTSSKYLLHSTNVLLRGQRHPCQAACRDAVLHGCLPHMLQVT